MPSNKTKARRTGRPSAGNRVKCVIFDLDGTLIDAYRAVYTSMNYALTKSGFPRVSAEMIKRNVGWGDRHLLARFVGEEQSYRVLKIYRKHHKTSLLTGSKLLPGARRLLDSLSRDGYTLAVASNRPSVYSRIVMKVLDIHRYFDYVLCGDQVKKAKPHPQMLREILARFQLKPRHALYVGDMSIDIQAGRRARIKTVAVTTGSCKRKELQVLRPFGVIPRVDEVSGILARINV